MSEPISILRTERYTEGVVVDRDGTVYFSMTALGTISRFRPGETCATVWAHVPAANGHAIASDATHVVMSSVGAVLRLDPSGRTTDVLAAVVEGRWLAYPNDVALDSLRGGSFVTDSGSKTTPKTESQDPQGRVYRIDADGRVRSVADGLAYANGIALSPDGTRLYVGESVTGCLWTYDVGRDGTLGARTLFARTPAVPDVRTVPDGMSVGANGRLYVAHYGAGEVLVYERDGSLVRRLAAGNRTTSHVAFAQDARRMYVSGGIDSESGPGAIFAIDLD